MLDGWAAGHDQDNLAKKMSLEVAITKWPLSKRVHLELSAMQLMTLNALSAGLLVAVTSAGMAQELPRPPEVPRPPELLRTRFCIGSGNCPVLVQVMKNCGSDAHQIAQEICTIHRAGGESRVLEYQLLHEGNRDGGRCGYNWYTVVCLR
jgi:hypothetical protein